MPTKETTLVSVWSEVCTELDLPWIGTEKVNSILSVLPKVNGVVASIVAFWAKVDEALEIKAYTLVELL